MDKLKKYKQETEKYIEELNDKVTRLDDFIFFGGFDDYDGQTQDCILRESSLTRELLVQTKRILKILKIRLGE